LSPCHTLYLSITQALATDLASSLFPDGDPQASRLKIKVVNSKHVVLTGGRWKNKVVDWLTSRGF
jgi:large subunit ribosomal protein L49